MVTFVVPPVLLGADSKPKARKIELDPRLRFRIVIPAIVPAPVGPPPVIIAILSAGRGRHKKEGNNHKKGVKPTHSLPPLISGSVNIPARDQDLPGCEPDRLVSVHQIPSGASESRLRKSVPVWPEALGFPESGSFLIPVKLKGAEGGKVNKESVTPISKPIMIGTR
jgi:hypothetical protein